MKKEKIQLSTEFKTQATKAIIAIGLFVLTYLVILLLTVLLTGLCIAAGVALIAIKPMFATVALGIGLSSLGILILIFLLKFISKSHKVDRSNLIEIEESQEPVLFSMINEIVLEVDTAFPKKVYLSSDVNAGVFYDSSFWSMFLPVKKNLQIGLGLVNSVTKEELKAILSHEFGHFSQRTMKVGSYVYNVNQVIFNMLYDNEPYKNLIQTWANVSRYFSIFVVIAVKINEGIQWILRKLYEIVNKSYLGLSREMEFHADEIAASVTGYQPLKKSLLRMTLSENSFNEVLNFYSGKISGNIKSENLYRDQTSVIHFLAEENNLNMTNDLPDISLEEQSKFNKSKLVIKNQWASHPTTEERVARLEKTGFSAEYKTDAPANDIFSDIAALQKQFTEKIFEAVTYSGETKSISSGEFIDEYRQNVVSNFNSLPQIYNGYYDHKNPADIDLNQSTPIKNGISFKELYDDEKIDWIYTAIALQKDMETLKKVADNTLLIKTLDYDGIRYKRKNIDALIERLTTELEHINEQIKGNDNDIYAYFKNEEYQQKKPKEIERLYSEFLEFDKIFDSKYDLYVQLMNGLQFVRVTTPYSQIRANLNEVKPIEEQLKQEMNRILLDNTYATEITPEIKHNLEQYTSKTWEYFSGTSYNNDHLDILYTAVQNYAYLLSRKYFLMKKAILTYQEELMLSQK
jgi:Zn-dependent protease with chaperone function